MSEPVCPMCEMTDVLDHPWKWECVTCGHEWEKTPEPEGPAGPRVVKDAHGQVLVDGECVVLTKDLPLKGSSQSFKGKRHAEHLCWSGGIDAIGIGLWPR